MRNSLLPLALTALVVVGAVLLIPESQGLGVDGPELPWGILRLPKDEARIVPSAPLALDQRVEPGPVGRAPGLEPDPWRVVAVAAEDDRPLTRAAVLGLAEVLTRRGAVAVVQRHGEMPMAMAADRVLRVATLAADEPGAEPAAFHGRVAIRQEATRLPADHPAAGLQAATGIAVRELVVDHRSTPQGAPPWPQWWAGVGRAIADGTLGALGLGAQVPRDWDRPAFRVQPPPRLGFAQPGFLLIALLAPALLLVRRWLVRRLPPTHRSRRGVLAWLRPVVLAGALVWIAVHLAGPRTGGRPANEHGWTTRLPVPIDVPEITWHGAFEDDLVRGWTGRIAGRTTLDRAQRELSAIEPVLRVLTRYSAKPGEPPGDRWVEVGAPESAARTFRREKDGAEELFTLTPRDGGWDCVLWQERSRPADAVTAWIAGGSRADRRRLRRHLLAPRLPADVRAQAQELLRRDPDAVEVAMLAEAPDATAGERRFAHAARWVLGREDGPPPADDGGATPWMAFLTGVPTVGDARPLLIQVREAFVLILPAPAGGGRIVARSPAGAAEAGLEERGATTLDLPGGGAVIVDLPGDGTMTVTAR